MNLTLEQFQSDPLQALAALVLFFVLYVLTGVLPLCGILYVFYFLLTLPMRRNERARMFIDVLEVGLKEGRTAEAAIIDAATSRDRSLGVRFHLLAEYLAQGVKLSQALDRVPQLLPTPVRAMLRTGERIGDLQKVLPACRQFLKDGVSNVRGALNYVILLVFVITPFAILVPVVLRTHVLPKFQQIFADMLSGSVMPAFTRLVFQESGTLTFIQIAAICFLWLVLLFYVGGPRLRGWVHRFFPGATDWMSYRLPWRRKRLQRDFSTMLALLLEAEVPESEAIELAADSTANLAVQRRATKVRSLLNEGIKLPEALRIMDNSGELQWRITNALRGRGGFLRALAGWHEALDAKAFQLEQSAAQITTTVLVLLNGFVVACIVIAVFLALVQLINNVALW